MVDFIQFYNSHICMNEDLCFCEGLEGRIILLLTDSFIYWSLWLILFMLTENYSKRYRIILFSICYIFLIFYYIFGFDSSLQYAPIYIFSTLIFVIAFIIHHRKNSFKELLIKLFRAEAYMLVIFCNYFFIMFFLPKFENLMENIYLSILNFFYVLLFFCLLKENIVRFVVYLEERKSEIKHKDILIILASRISVCYLFSFMSAPFLKFQSEYIGSYFLILSYINNLFALYTGKNIITDNAIKIWNYLMKNHQNYLINTYIDEKTIKAQKFILGSTLDISFISSVRMLTYNLWSARMLITNCHSISTEILGILIILAIDLTMTITIFLYMLKKREILFSYKRKLNKFLNIYVLFLVHSLFEINIVYFSVK